MNMFGHAELCTQDGCGHKQSDHVGDHVRRPEGWVTVKRCIVCEHEGGACTESAAVHAEDDAAS